MEKTIVTLGARTHEQACVVSAGFRLHEGDARALTEALRAQFVRLNDWCDEHGVIVGHIKGFCSWADRAIMVTTTGEGVQVKGDEPAGEPTELDAGIACILFGAPLEEIVEGVRGTVEGVFAALALPCEIEVEFEHEHDHDHDHEHEHHHHHHEHEHEHEHHHEHHHGD